MLFLPEHEEHWMTVIDSFQRQLARVQFETWIKPMKLYSVRGFEVTATYPQDDFRFGVASTRYASMVDAMVKTVFGLDYNFNLIRDSEINAAARDQTMLNPNYTFDNFIAGASNSLALSAALAVAEDPSTMYNPLFIYGDVGLGKTHLMNAIGNYILETNPRANVLFTTSERFISEMVEVIQNKRGGPQFRAKMRSLDVLMVDDVQFFGKTTATQEEFFHTFNELREAGKQIVMSSDRPPNELPAIEERLRSRMSMGLCIDIKRPDFETRVAILRRKCEDENIDISYESVEYIAAHFDRSIRDLEGALNRVQAHARILGREDDIDLELTQMALEGLASSTDSRVVTPRVIMEVTARKFGVTTEDLTGKKRNREIAVPRQVAIFLCREMTDLSTTNIGKEFGNRDHTTVMHSCEKVTAVLTTDTNLSRKLAELRSEIKGA